MKTNTFENPKKIKFDKTSIYYLMHQLYDIILSSPKGIIEQFSVNVLLYESLFFRVFPSIHIHVYLCYLLHASQMEQLFVCIKK